MLTTVNTNLKVTGLLYNNAGHALDCPNSYHVSGSGATEIRHMTIVPNMLKADDDATDGAYAEVVADSGTDPYTVLSGAEYNMSVRLSSGVSEGYVYLPKPPEGWKATAIYVSLFHKTDNI